MELLLNLAWLLLALPAYWLWRGRTTTRPSNSLQCLLALACVLVILFPVISATDDLLVMRAEMEESPVSKRSLRISSDKASLSGCHNPAAMVSSSCAVSPGGEDWIQVSTPSLSIPAPPAVERHSRAPPASFLG
jgi:hypothetical protein